LLGNDEGASGSRARDLTIVIAVLTYKRLPSLRDLLARLPELRLPERAEFRLVVVDNDPEASARDLVVACQLPMQILYLCEPRKGIPVARNRALRQAYELNADLLCFIDDDEIPDVSWLDRLVARWRGSEAHLIGGPVEVLPTNNDASPWQRLVNASLAARMRRKNRRTAQSERNGRRFTVVTNNWLGDLGFLAEKKIAFDETLLVTGGSDTKFHADALRHGARTAWAVDATVRERMPAERLTFRYQLKRAAMQSMQHFHMARPHPTFTVVLRTLALVPVRFLTGTLLFIVPIYGIASPVMAVRSIGWAAGRVAALLGYRSVLYL
jgi:glycosyltransferase involved in cell wall biosynthesis